MKYYILSLLLAFSGLNLYGQDCGTFHLFNFQDSIIDDWIWDEPRKGFYFDMTYDEITAPNTGYISFALVDTKGDTITNTDYYKSSYFFPFKPGDTTRYAMVLRDGITEFPANFKGYLVTYNPECTIPVNIVTTNLVENIGNNKLELFPNPSNEYLNIRTNKVIKKIEILDVNGIVLLSLKDQTNLVLRSLSSGIYLVRLTYQDNSQSFDKFIRN